MTQLIDDGLLGALLRGFPAPSPDQSVHTTGYWYVRLCQAVLSRASRPGMLSTPFADLPLPARERALLALLELPDWIGLESLRTLAPLIGHLRRSYQLNALGMEVLAAAVHLEADVYLSAPSPRLEEALHAENRRVEITRLTADPV